ncbi:PD-(D/E)XK nuclease family protein [Adhaeribacter soli]|uniref:PD-(D/E)XK nuclease family protein n=1 Tax=Adhaeribacter soli TaxID=2607655 RepID=A0A5N1JB15_9BACT|nr:PD-(D/E)XK nuclease family protein [Adhaeribacter soli]KAA9346059.1 PD-(D/E)XK nuclease family protein [Adhaeribacter soli]
MQTFLQHTAAALLQKYPDNISQLCVIVPTRRAGLYFKNALAKLASNGLWSPEVSSMEDFVCNLAKAEIVEPISLQLELYDIIQEFDQKLDFDQYVSWAGTLLEDFNRIDQNLVATDKLFEYLSEAKALERWDPEALGQPISSTVANYFKLWDNLEKTYRKLRQNLRKKKQSYPGMAFRYVAENVKEITEKTTCHRYIFIGLNALSRSEEKIVRTLLSLDKADVFFDADEYYLAADSPNRAGHFLRQYRKKWSLPEWNFSSNELLTSEKEINVIGVANASMQGRVAGQLLDEIRSKQPNAEVAIVLPDENMLLPVLHSIGEKITDYNVTMGLTLKGTSLFNLVDLLFDVHLTGIIQPGQTGYAVQHYHYLAVNKLLSHPFIRRYEHYLHENLTDQPEYENLVQNVVTRILEENRILLSAQTLIELGKEHPLFQSLFRPWKNCDDIIAALFEIIDLLKDIYRFELINPVETEYLYHLFTIVKRLDSIFDCRQQKISVRSFKKFLYEQIGQTRLPFEGEPISEIQVMGMLETRALDFENLIILSVNEKTLPAPKKHSSLMPYDVLREFGLPTYSEQESITSYHFYRLLQRAKTVSLLYVQPSDTFGAAEKSRFILQLANHLAPLNPKIKYTEQTGIVVQTEKKSYNHDIIIEKDEAVLSKLKANLKKGLFPSHLNMWVRCNLQYYFTKVAGLKESNKMDEQIGTDQFGNIVHKVLEDFYQPFMLDGTPVTISRLEEMLKQLPEKVKQEFKRGTLEALPEQGMNHLLYKVALKILHKYLELEIKSGAYPLKVLKLEESLETTLQVPVGEELVEVKLAGKADRIDRTGNKIRVIDYKTGFVNPTDLKVKTEDLETHFLSNKKYEKVRQLWLYRYLMEKSLSEIPIMAAENGMELPEKTEVEASILSFRNLDKGLMKAQLNFTDEGFETTEEFLAESEKYLHKFIRQMLDPEEPIHKTNDLEVCQYCPYRGICAR